MFKLMSSLPLRASDILTALSLTLDAQRQGNFYHAWRVALVAQAAAAEMCPELRADVFYAALLHDIGNVDADQHIAYAPQRQTQPTPDRTLRNHPAVGAAVVAAVPELARLCDLIRCHHECWDGSGYPEGRRQSVTPLGAQIIRVADAADLSGAYKSDASFQGVLRQMRMRTGHEWSQDVWAAFLKVFANGAVSRMITRDYELPGLIAEAQSEVGEMDLDQDPAEALETLFRLFARVIDAKHDTCFGHSEQVVRWAAVIGEAMGLSKEDARLLRWSGFVHDAGKVAVPKSVLDRSGKLSRDEIEAVRSHAAVTGDIFRTFVDSPTLLQIADIACHHHERYDGVGYPHGLAGPAIPPLARILVVADAYDAMTSHRVYRQGLMPGVAMERLQMNCGTQFDPVVVDAFVELYRSERAIFAAA